jgi:bacillithiol system protein YtxJ
MNWKDLTTIAQINDIIERSHQVPCVILKHSTRCNISAMAKYRLEDDWDFKESELEPYLLDLITYREVSNQLAEIFQVHHESPQVLLISGGECTYDASHLDITVAELHEVMAFSK